MPSVEGVKISQLPQATTADGSDVLAGVQYGTTKRFPLSVLIAWIKSHIGLTAADVGAQPTITASGILKGDGAGGVSAAVAGTDYGTYSKPSGGIPASDLASGVIPTVPTAYTSNPAMDGTASPGSSGAWARGDHVHPSDTSKANSNTLGKELLDPAGQNVAYGEYCTYQGNVYIANTAITPSMSASTFISYLDPVNNGGLNSLYYQLAALSEDVATFASGISGTKYIRKRNSIVTVELNNISGLTGHDSVIMTLSQGFRPKNNINFMGFIRSGSGWATATLYLASLYIDTNGVVRVSGNSSQIASGNFYGNATYMV